MKMTARLLTLALIVVPAAPAMAAATTPAMAAPAVPTPSAALAAPASLAAPGGAAASAAPAEPTAASVTVAKYTFDAGATAGRIAENSGRGLPLTVRTDGGGTVRFIAANDGRYLGFPARCATGARTCPRALLEAASDADLNPGIRPFRWGATVFLTQAQMAGSSNVMQKGVTTTNSQWKLQIGATHGKAQCVVVGQGSARAYIARSTVSVADGKWHRVMCLRYGAALGVSVDGVSGGRAVVPAALSIVNTKPLRIGGPNFNTTSDMYHGYLDDVFAMLG